MNDLDYDLLQELLKELAVIPTPVEFCYFTFLFQSLFWGGQQFNWLLQLLLLLRFTSHVPLKKKKQPRDPSTEITVKLSIS